MKNRIMTLAALLTWPLQLAFGEDCYRSTIMEPNPFMGTEGEVFVLYDGSAWEVEFEHEFLYAHNPSVAVCPAGSVVIVQNAVLDVRMLKPALDETKQVPTDGTNFTIRKEPDCSYLVANGPSGHNLVQWIGGHIPDEFERFIGELGSYGMTTVFFPAADSESEFHVEDYYLSRNDAFEKLDDYCEN